MRERDAPALRTGAELPRLERRLDQAKIDRYARVSGDHNPLHTDPAFAAGTPFGGTVAHGMLLLAYLSELMTLAFGRRWLEAGRLRARFRAPARPGDTVAVGGRVTGAQGGQVTCTLECRNQRGELLVSAEAQLPAPAEAS